MKRDSISVIGSGFGGLSAAIRLAHAGYDVTVYEKNSYPGGKAGSVNSSGFRFDSGPSLLTMPFVIEELFSSVNENMEEYITLNKLDVLCRYYFPGGTVLNAFSNRGKFAAEIEARTGETRENLVNYLDYCENIYRLTSDIFLFNNLYSAKTYMNAKALKTLFKISKIDSFRTMNEANSNFLTTGKLFSFLTAMLPITVQIRTAALLR